MTFRQLARVTALVVVASFISRDADAQSLASRVANARDGKVRFTFAPKPPVCGSGNSISRGGRNRMNWSPDQSPDVVYDDECSHTPVRIVLSVRSGKVTKLRTYVGGEWRTPTEPTTDIGAVSTREATNYLLSLASTDDGAIAQQAILPAILADSVNVNPELFRLARDDSRPHSVREQALFWLGQEAADKIAPDNSEDSRESADDDVKKQAVFALSQRRRDESVPALIQVARNNRDPQVRRTALFWLGQTGDPRAVSLFEEILR